jgi:hypothetical protein
MKNTSMIFLILLLLVNVLFSACDKEGTDTPPANPSYKGDFVNSAHSTKGIASIDQGETTLTLTNFKTDNGPDLNIYIASNLNAVTSDYIDLGDIKGLNGTYTYKLPDGKDYTAYKYIIIWCVDFDVNFGYAELVKQ